MTNGLLVDLTGRKLRKPHSVCRFTELFLLLFVSLSDKSVSAYEGELPIT